MKKALILFFVLILGYGGIFVMSRRLEKDMLAVNQSFADEDLYLSARHLNMVGSDFKGLLADWYWIQSLQYMGDKIIAYQGDININDLRPLNPRLIYPMLDTAATLDPQFTTVYSYGAAILPSVDPDQAIKLLEKGVAANADDWRLYHNLGYIYWQTKNYQKAAEIYSVGATKKDAPIWMKQMSANMQAQGSSRDFAKQVYKQMYDTAEDEQTKSFAELRFAQTQSLDDRDEIRQGLKIFSQRNNRCPQNWRELLPILDRLFTSPDKALPRNEKGELVDPTNVPYALENQDGKCDVRLSNDSKIPQN